MFDYDFDFILFSGSQWQDQCAETHRQHHHLSLRWQDSEAVGQSHQETGALKSYRIGPGIFVAFDLLVNPMKKQSSDPIH